MIPPFAEETSGAVPWALVQAKLVTSYDRFDPPARIVGRQTQDSDACQLSRVSSLLTQLGRGGAGVATFLGCSSQY